ncbi:RNA-directed DNA polymerase, eukaryota, reverse transcriptase zinc-binding domain protein [Tanacetum coccineum]
MDNLNITMEEYIRLEEEKARRHDMVHSPRDRRHQYLRFELQYTNVDIADFETRLGMLRDRVYSLAELGGGCLRLEARWYTSYSDYHIPIKPGIIMEYLVKISKKARIVELKTKTFEDYCSDIQYTVSIKEDTAYMCLHFTKDHKGSRINTPYLEESIRCIQVMIASLVGPAGDPWDQRVRSQLIGKDLVSGLLVYELPLSSLRKKYHLSLKNDMPPRDNRDDSERYGSECLRTQAHIFNSFIDAAGLFDIPLGGRMFTWMSKAGMKMSKLDQFLISHSVMDSSSDFKVTTLPREWSDHTPLLLHYEKDDYGPVPFKFFHSWLQRDGFNDCIVNAYSECSQEVSRIHEVCSRLNAIDGKIDFGIASEEEK